MTSYQLCCVEEVFIVQWHHSSLTSPWLETALSPIGQRQHEGKVIVSAGVSIRRVFIVHSDSSSILVIQRHVPLYYSFNYTTGVNCRQPFCFWCPSSVRSDLVIWTVIRKHLVPAPQWRFLCVTLFFFVKSSTIYLFFETCYVFLWECDKNKRK